MKKRVFSVALVIAMMVVALSGSVTPAAAIYSYDFYLLSAHGELVIDLPQDDNATSQTVRFTVPYHGWYIIQTMGFPSVTSNNDMYNGHTGVVILKDSAGRAVTANGVSRVGYGFGKLINCELYAGEEYTITIHFENAVGARLVITHAQGLFNQLAPIGNYNQITSFEPDVIEFTFTQSNHQQAQVALVEHSEEVVVDFEVDVYGSPFACAYLLDPRVSDDTGSTMLYSGCTVPLDSGVPYYLVVYLEQGDTPVDFPLTVTVTFTPVG